MKYFEQEKNTSTASKGSNDVHSLICFRAPTKTLKRVLTSHTLHILVVRLNYSTTRSYYGSPRKQASAFLAWLASRGFLWLRKRKSD